jgi:hypothetical protein
MTSLATSSFIPLITLTNHVIGVMQIFWPSRARWCKGDDLARSTISALPGLVHLGSARFCVLKSHMGTHHERLYYSDGTAIPCVVGSYSAL